MGLAALKVGQDLHLENEEYRITRIFGPERIEIEHRATGAHSERTEASLLKAYSDGHLTFGAPRRSLPHDRAHREANDRVIIESLSDEQREIVLLRLHFVQNLVGVSTTRHVFDAQVRTLWEKLGTPEKKLWREPPPASTVCRWRKRWLEMDCSIGALLGRHARCGNRKARVPDKVTEIVDKAIQDVYLRPERRTIGEVVTESRDQIIFANQRLTASEKLPLIGRRYVQRRIKLLPAFDVDRARHGRQAAIVKYRSSGKGAVADEPMQRAQMDHCELDLFVVDEATALPLGRPWLTVIIDVCTRMVLGYTISFNHPSSMTVMRALRHALLPKERKPGHVNEWPTWGVIQVIVVDNGVEFHGRSLEFTAAQFAITVQICPRVSPWFKGMVERYFRTVQSGVVAQIPGRTFKDVVSRGDYDSMGFAIITMSTLTEVIEKWIVDVYHQDVHSGIGEPPLQLFNRLVPQTQRYLPDCASTMDAAFGKPDTRVLGHQGIEFDCLFYNSPAAGAIRTQHGDRVDVQVVTNDDDVGYLYVLEPLSGEPIKIPAVDIDYASGMTRWQHRICKEHARSVAKNSAEPLKLAQAREAISELIARDLSLNKKRARKSIARYQEKARTSAAPSTQPADQGASSSSGDLSRDTSHTVAPPTDHGCIDDDAIPNFETRAPNQPNQDAQP